MPSAKSKGCQRTHLPDGQGYEPMVTVRSKQVNGKIELSVIDNGIGVPLKVLDKIF